MTTNSIQQSGNTGEAAALLVANAALPFEQARAMPPGVYTSEEFLQDELEQIFRKDWFCAGRQRISEPRGLPDA